MKNGTRRAGDSVTLAIDRHGGMVYRLAYARTRSHADAEDIFQEVFMKMLRNAPEFENEGHEKAWLIRTTANMTVNLLKSARRRLGVSQSVEPTAPENDGELADALNALDRRTRTVVHLYYFEGLRCDEIAKVLEQKPAAIRARLARGRRKLKDILSDEGGV